MTGRAVLLISVQPAKVQTSRSALCHRTDAATIFYFESLNISSKTQISWPHLTRVSSLWKQMQRLFLVRSSLISSKYHQDIIEQRWDESRVVFRENVIFSRISSKYQETAWYIMKFRRFDSWQTTLVSTYRILRITGTWHFAPKNLPES